MNLCDPWSKLVFSVCLKASVPLCVLWSAVLCLFRGAVLYVLRGLAGSRCGVQSHLRVLRSRPWAGGEPWAPPRSGCWWWTGSTGTAAAPPVQRSSTDRQTDRQTGRQTDRQTLTAVDLVPFVSTVDYAVTDPGGGDTASVSTAELVSLAACRQTVEEAHLTFISCTAHISHSYHV